MKNNNYNIVLLRRDLRLEDNPALDAATQEGDPILLVYIMDEVLLKLGVKSSHFTYLALRRISNVCSGKLIFKVGKTSDVLSQLCKDNLVKSIFVNWHSDPYLIKSLRFKNEGLLSRLAVCKDAFVNENAVHSKRKCHYQVFSWYYRKIVKTDAFNIPIPFNKNILKKIAKVGGDFDRLDVLKSDRFDEDDLILQTAENPVEALADWIDKSLSSYGQEFNNVCKDVTSLLSSCIAQGLISKRIIVAHLKVEVQKAEELLSKGKGSHNLRFKGAERMIRNLVWNEFAHYYAKYYPEMSGQSLCPPSSAPKLCVEKLTKWKSGNTGVSIVDAAMKILVNTGYIHNKLRLVAASYFVNILNLPWQYGAKFFEKHLVDADRSVNSFNWQWVALTLPNSQTREKRKITNFEAQQKKLDPTKQAFFLTDIYETGLSECKAKSLKTDIEFQEDPQCTSESFFSDWELKEMGLTRESLKKSKLKK